MFILGLDCSNKFGGLALWNSETDKIIEYSFAIQYSQSSQLIPQLKYLLQNNQLDITDIGLLSVTVGPGSFTGLRIGLMTVKIISDLLQIPVIGISTLELMAYPYRHKNHLLCPILPALNRDIYFGIYKPRNGILQIQSEDRLLSLDEFNLFLEKSYPDKSIYIIGAEDLKYSAELREQFKNKLLFPDKSEYKNISAKYIAQLGWEKYQSGLFPSINPFNIQPNYLHKPKAELVHENRDIKNYKK